MKKIELILEKLLDNGRFVGIVTIEDAVEEIVGNIYDEFDDRK